MSSLSAPSSAIGPPFSTLSLSLLNTLSGYLYRARHGCSVPRRGVLFFHPAPSSFPLAPSVSTLLPGLPLSVRTVAASAPSSLATQTSINFAGSGPAVFQFRVSPVNAKHGPRYDEMVVGRRSVERVHGRGRVSVCGLFSAFRHCTHTHTRAHGSRKRGWKLAGERGTAGIGGKGVSRLTRKIYYICTPSRFRVTTAHARGKRFFGRI